MGYLFLVLSSCCNAVKGLAGKKISYVTNTVNDVSFFYCLRMVLSAIIGAILIFAIEGAGGFKIEVRELLLAAACGVAFSINCMFWIYAQRRGAYAICDALLVASSLIPILLSYFIYHEPLTIWDLIGYAAVCGGCILVVSYNNQINKKVTIPLVIIYLIYIISFACFDFVKKIYNYDVTNGITKLSANGFTFYTFLFSALTFLIFYFATFKKESFAYQKSLFWKELPYVVITAVLTYGYAYLLVLASGVSATIQYPLKNALGLMLNILVAAVVLKEKPTLRLFVGVEIIIGSLVLIALL